MTKFIVRLKKPHDKSGLSAYRVWKLTGIAENTVRKYTQEEFIVTDRIHIEVVILAQFYGVPWTDVVTVVCDEDDEEPNDLPLPEHTVFAW